MFGAHFACKTLRGHKCSKGCAYQNTNVVSVWPMCSCVTCHLFPHNRNKQVHYEPMNCIPCRHSGFPAKNKQVCSLKVCSSKKGPVRIPNLKGASAYPQVERGCCMSPSAKGPVDIANYKKRDVGFPTRL